MTNQNRNVAIVGAGLIGRAWAAIFARAGWNVRLTDPHQPTLKAAPGLIRDELLALARHGLANDPDGAAARLSIAAESGRRRQGRRIRPGKRTGKDRREDCDLCRARQAHAAARAAGVLDLGHHRVALHRRTCRAARAAWSAIPSIRRIWCRWSNCAARHGPRPRRSTVRETSIARSGRFRSPSTARSTALFSTGCRARCSRRPFGWSAKAISRLMISTIP